MLKRYLIIYENNDGDIFKKIYTGFTSQKEALEYFKEKNAKYGYKVLAIRNVTANIYYL